MPTKFIMISTMLCGAAMAGIRSGKATVAWIGESVTCEAGKPLQTAIRMVHDPGWHSYWINPGEAGVKTSVSWKLPPGWKTGGLGYPAPSRFTTSGLAGFGYEGTVLLPVKITPPEDFTGTARLSAVISWLACGEAGCVPGKAEIHLDLSAGIPKQTEEAREILAAHPPPALREIPRGLPSRKRGRASSFPSTRRWISMVASFSRPRRMWSIRARPSGLLETAEHGRPRCRKAHTPPVPSNSSRWWSLPAEEMKRWNSRGPHLDASCYLRKMKKTAPARQTAAAA
jgi:hypothetical protein